MTTRECWERVQSLVPGVEISVSHTVRGEHETVHVFRHDTEANIYLVADLREPGACGARDLPEEAIERVGRGEWKAKPVTPGGDR